jgi:Zn-dependent peptidase ImmA (M78 family)
VIFIAPIFRKALKGWNKKRFDGKDFDRITKQLGVLVIEDGSEDMVRKGLYTEAKGVPIIFVRPELTGLEKLWVLFHELGHHLLHSPATCYFSESTQHKTEHEASVFAAIALIPQAYVRQMYLWDLYDVDEFAAKLFEIRLEVYEAYKV